MYSVVLLTALAASPVMPAFGNGCGCYGGYAAYSSYAGRGGYGAYAPYGSYAGYGCRGCYGCGGCGGTIVPSYGCYGAGFGYHGGCYGAYGTWAGEPYFGSCYGCHGGYSGYGIPLPIPDARVAVPTPLDPFPPINPKKEEKKIDKDKEPEVFVPKEKKPAIDDKKPIDKKDPEEQVRAKVRIDIPTGGRLFVDGHRINGTGARLFQTPPLAPGQKYYYDIRIEVERNGQTIAEQRRVIVEPGHAVAVAFPNLASGTATAQAEE